MESEPRWGEPPSGDMIADLLVERFPIGSGETVTVDVTAEDRSLTLSMNTAHHRYRIKMEYLRGAGSRDPWFVMVDALDAIFGTFIESNRAYRDIPTGEDVEFDDTFFRIRVEHEMPEMDRIADQILKEK